MKPGNNENYQEIYNNKEENHVVGDVIGDTAYSERFVLKLLLKFADLDKLKEELLEKTFEDDLCTLWDMTAERDVVLFLLQHDLLDLFNFAWPLFESPRIIEIVLGIIGNMCCQKEAEDKLLQMELFVSFLVEYAKSDDSLVIIQLLRLVNSSLYLAEEEQVLVWMRIFINAGYSSALYFILKNSSKKDLLITALENFNTICSCCNIEKSRRDFYGHFVTSEAAETLSTAFIEITNNQKHLCQKEELERILIITLQILLNLFGFDKTLDIFNDNKNEILNIIAFIFTYYEKKFVGHKEIDLDLVDIIDSTKTIVNLLQLSSFSNPSFFFTQSYNMWKTLKHINILDKSGTSSFETDDKEDLEKFTKQMETSLSELIIFYFNKCSDEDLIDCQNKIGSDYDDIIGAVKNSALLDEVLKRSVYRTRLKETSNVSKNFNL